MRAFAVIGAAWGDECKGAAVDKIASLCPEAVVIRHSGGAQAGHTVITPEGKRHIFSHFGSGTLAGCPTYLGKEFVVNPRIFVKELAELEALGVKPKVYVHPEAIITTPIDVAINRELEKRRGDSRHGSVGIGFGETIERSTREGGKYAFRMIDLDDFVITTYKLISLFPDWYGKRFSELDLLDMDLGDIEEDGLRNGRELGKIFKYVTIAESPPKSDTYIFEGAQGLLLDQKIGIEFPYVTRSNTGLQNVMPICDQVGIKKLKVVYMHRPYMTRHGAGPMPGERHWYAYADNFNVVDNTNIHGEWQGALRLAPMNYHIIKEGIRHDLKGAAAYPVDIEYYSGRSCLDQAKKWVTTPPDLDIEPALFGWGPSRRQYEVKKTFIDG